jgi:hypothetical protein
MVGDFPFMLSLVEAFLGFSAESIAVSDPGAFSDIAGHRVDVGEQRSLLPGK